MEAKRNPNDTEPIETATPAGMNDAAGLAGTAFPETGRRVRNRLVSGWHFTAPSSGDGGHDALRDGVAQGSDRGAGQAARLKRNS